MRWYTRKPGVYLNDLCVWLSTNVATEIAEATKNVLQINVDQNLKNFGNN